MIWLPGVPPSFGLLRFTSWTVILLVVIRYPPFVGPRSWRRGGRRRPVLRIVSPPTKLLALLHLALPLATVVGHTRDGCVPGRIKPKDRSLAILGGSYATIPDYLAHCGQGGRPDWA